jgi:hypothetical protein
MKKSVYLVSTLMLIITVIAGFEVYDSYKKLNKMNSSAFKDLTLSNVESYQKSVGNKKWKNTVDSDIKLSEMLVDVIRHSENSEQLKNNLFDFYRSDEKRYKEVFGGMNYNNPNINEVVNKIELQLSIDEGVGVKVIQK